MEFKRKPQGRQAVHLICFLGEGNEGEEKNKSMPFKMAHLADKTGWGTGGRGAVVERKKKEAQRLGKISRCQKRHA